jgi:hypothetical protein
MVVTDWPTAGPTPEFSLSEAAVLGKQQLLI